MFKNKISNAFTLAEVLITLGIIGVVAAMTIPTLVANYQQRSMDTAANVFTRKLGEALKVMNANSTLAGYNTTADFVNELGKNIKIVKTCDSEHLTNCFIDTINTGADPIDTTKLKKSKNLYSTTDYGTETIGVQFANGVSALIAYNKNAKQDPFNNSNGENAIVSVTSSGSGKDLSIGLGTDALSILYDVSGLKTPNSYGTGKDIRGVNINIKTGAAIKNLGTISTSVDCSTTAKTSTDPAIKSDYDTYCGASPSGYSSDYWAGAKKACVNEDMHLPTIEEFRDLYARKGEEGIPTEGLFWSASDCYGSNAWILRFSDGRETNPSKGSSGKYVLCVDN